MPWNCNVLVVANVTATSDELIEAMRARASREECAFTLIVPATVAGGGLQAATNALEEALVQMRQAGVDVSGAVGSGDPYEAVVDIWNPKVYDEIIISTLPLSSSKWLHGGLPERIRKLTGAHVTHVVAQQPHEDYAGSPAPVRQPNHLGPLSVLGWGTGEKKG